MSPPGTWKLDARNWNATESKFANSRIDGWVVGPDLVVGYPQQRCTVWPILSQNELPHRLVIFTGSWTYLN